ncbi:unnamed protein product [Sphagnum balticum]
MKKELQEKGDYNNKKYLENVYGGKIQLKDPYYADEVKLEQKGALRPRPQENLVLEEYEVPDLKQLTHEKMMRNDSEMMSLDGESKKIPVDLETSQKLSISRLGDYAKDSNYFMKKKSAGYSPQNYAAESIKE